MDRAKFTQNRKDKRRDIGNRKDKRRDIERKNEILKNGVNVGLCIFHIVSTTGFPQGSAG